MCLYLGDINQFVGHWFIPLYPWLKPSILYPLSLDVLDPLHSSSWNVFRWMEIIIRPAMSRYNLYICRELYKHWYRYVCLSCFLRIKGTFILHTYNISNNYNFYVRYALLILRVRDNALAPNRCSSVPKNIIYTWTLFLDDFLYTFAFMIIGIL